MANIVKLKRSATASAVPTTAQLQLGELAMNTFDGKLFLKKNNGTESIVEIGAGGGGGASVTISTTAPTSPTAGDLWWNSEEGKLKIYYTDANSSQWVDAYTASVGGDGSVNLSSPTAIGNVTPNTGKFTSLETTGHAGIGVAPTATSFITVGAGTATKAPIELTSGTNLTTPEAGAFEYDGVTPYFTGNTTSGRGYLPTIQVFGLAANGTAFGPAIGNFFGANSAVNLAGGGEYEVEAHCYFTKTTAGTVTVTATTSLAPVILNGTVDYGAATGGTATGAANRISLFASTATASAFGASASLTTGVNHCFRIRLVLSSNASPSNLRINFTCSAGTVTPLRESYYKVTRLPSANVGSFAA